MWKFGMHQYTDQHIVIFVGIIILMIDPCPPNVFMWQIVNGKKQESHMPPPPCLASLNGMNYTISCNVGGK
jgi:hypothetical protein